MHYFPAAAPYITISYGVLFLSFSGDPLLTQPLSWLIGKQGYSLPLVSLSLSAMKVSIEWPCNGLC